MITVQELPVDINIQINNLQGALPGNDNIIKRYCFVNHFPPVKALSGQSDYRDCEAEPGKLSGGAAPQNERLTGKSPAMDPTISFSFIASMAAATAIAIPETVFTTRIF